MGWQCWRLIFSAANEATRRLAAGVDDDVAAAAAAAAAFVSLIIVFMCCAMVGKSKTVENDLEDWKMLASKLGSLFHDQFPTFRNFPHNTI